MDVSKCGVYLSLYEIAEAFALGGKVLFIRFPLVIPFDGILSLQGFTLYPKCTFGSFSLIIRLTSQSLVIARVDPSVSIDKMTHLHHSIIGGENYQTRFLQIAHFVSAASTSNRNRFYQLGNPVSLIANCTFTEAGGNITGVEYTNSEVIFGSATISAVQIKSYVHGYKIQDKLREFLKAYFSAHPFGVAAEMIRSYSFPNQPTERGIDTQINVPLTHMVEAIVLFPRHHNDITCYLNPKYKNLQLKFLDQSWPDTAVNTTDPTFFRSQLQANQLDVLLQCTESFENSYMIDFLLKYLRVTHSSQKAQTHEIIQLSR
jgi:hypothetical protein